MKAGVGNMARLKRWEGVIGNSMIQWRKNGVFAVLGAHYSHAYLLSVASYGGVFWHHDVD